MCKPTVTQPREREPMLMELLIDSRSGVDRLLTVQSLRRPNGRLLRPDHGLRNHHRLVPRKQVTRPATGAALCARLELDPSAVLEVDRLLTVRVHVAAAILDPLMQ